MTAQLHDGKKYHLVDEPPKLSSAKREAKVFGYAEPNNGNGHILTTNANIDTDLGDLDLPEPLSPQQKRGRC